MAEKTIREVVIEITTKQVKTTLIPPDYDKVDRAASESAKAAVEAAKTQEAANRRVQSSVRQVASEFEKQGTSHTTATIKIVENNLKAADSFRTAGEGVFVLTRGIALLAFQDDDLLIVLRRVALIQGAFDTFKGSIEIIRGTREAITALTAATVAQEVATKTVTKSNGLWAVSNVVVADTAKKAAAATNTLKASMLPIGIAVAVIAVAVTALGVAWKASADAAKEATEQHEKRLKTIKDTTAEIIKQAQLQRDLTVISSAAASEQIANASDLEEKLRLARIQQEKIARGPRGGAVEALGLSAQDDFDRLDGVIEAQRREIARFKDLSELGGGSTDLLIGDREIAKAEAEITRALEQQKELRLQIAQGQAFSAKAAEDHARDRKSNEQNILRIQLAQNAAAIKKLDTQKEELRVAEEKRNKAANELRSARQVIGGLDPLKLGQIRRLSGKVKAGGTLTAGEQRQLGDIAGSDPTIGKFLGDIRSAQGKARGASGIIGAFGPGDLAGTATATQDAFGGLQDVTGGQAALDRKRSELQQQAANIALTAEEKISDLITIVERLAILSRRTDEDLARLKDQVDQNPLRNP